MIKREEVEALLREMRDALCRQHQGTWAPSAAFVQDHAARIEELARTWLRVNDAPVVLATEWIWENVPEELEGQRVKLVLVPEADSGGDRG